MATLTKARTGREEKLLQDAKFEAIEESKAHANRMTDKKKIRYLERELHSRVLKRRDPRSFHDVYELHNRLRVSRKRARSAEREVARLNALVIKLAEKL